MANTFLFANQASSTLAAPISSTATACSLASGTGSKFPNPSTNQQFAMTFNDAATGLLTEIVYVTAITGDAITTMVRAQEGTVAQTWSAGDLANALITAGTLAAFQQSATQNPARVVTTSGAFTITRSDVFGGIGLDRTSSPGTSSSTLPANAVSGDVYEIEDLADNFNQFPVTMNFPGGTSGPGGAASVVLNVSGQSAQFRLYPDNIWSFKP